MQNVNEININAVLKYHSEIVVILMCCLTLCSFRECRSLIFYDITIFVIFFPQLLKKKIIAS